MLEEADSVLRKGGLRGVRVVCKLCMVEGWEWARDAGRWRSSTSVEGRDEDDLVAVLQDIVELAFEFPIGRVDQDEDARSAASFECTHQRQRAGVSYWLARGRRGTTYTVSPCENNSGLSLSSS